MLSDLEARGVPTDRAMLEPAELGPTSDISRRVFRFEHEPFKMTVIDSWNETELDEGWQYMEATAERKSR